METTVVADHRFRMKAASGCIDASKTSSRTEPKELCFSTTTSRNMPTAPDSLVRLLPNGKHGSLWVDSDLIYDWENAINHYLHFFRCVYQACVWYFDHLAGQVPIIMLTDDEEVSNPITSFHLSAVLLFFNPWFFSWLENSLSRAWLSWCGNQCLRSVHLLRVRVKPKDPLYCMYVLCVCIALYPISA